MTVPRVTAAHVLIAITVLAALLAYFVTPREPLLELVTPQQELPDYQAHYPGDTGLADRMVKSYGLAMVLVRSPYTQKNVMALEAIRSWGREQFQQQPDFLHPVSLEPINERRNTLIEALTFNLFSAPRYYLENMVGEYLSWQIQNFHQSRSYKIFRNSYFDLFGVDADSAALLARYQADRAKLSVGVLLWTAIWLSLVISGLVWLARSPAEKRWRRFRLLLSYGWILLSPCYLARAWVENKVSVFVSSLVCLGIGLYLRYPFALHKDENGHLSIDSITLEVNKIALAAWLSYSLFAIQVVTWVKIGVLTDLDPVSLLVGALSGDFVHDPANAKRIIARVVGAIWVIVSIWAIRQSNRDAAAREAEMNLASLQGPAN